MSDSDNNPVDSTESAEDNRRDDPRLDVLLDISVSALSQSDLPAMHIVSALHTLDVSRTGIQVLLKQEVFQGSQVEIDICLKSDQSHIDLLGVVRWARYSEEAEAYLAGIEIDPDSPSILDWCALIGGLQAEFHEFDMLDTQG